MGDSTGQFSAFCLGVLLWSSYGGVSQLCASLPKNSFRDVLLVACNQS